MNINRLKTIAYAEGFVEDFLNEYIENLDEETASPQTLEQAQHLRNMWQVLSTGLKELRSENMSLDLKIESIKTVLAG